MNFFSAALLPSIAGNFLVGNKRQGRENPLAIAQRSPGSQTLPVGEWGMKDEKCKESWA